MIVPNMHSPVIARPHGGDALPIQSIHHGANIHEEKGNTWKILGQIVAFFMVTFINEATGKGILIFVDQVVMKIL